MYVVLYDVFKFCLAWVLNALMLVPQDDPQASEPMQAVCMKA